MRVLGEFPHSGAGSDRLHLARGDRTLAIRRIGSWHMQDGGTPRRGRLAMIAVVPLLLAGCGGAGKSANGNASANAVVPMDAASAQSLAAAMQPCPELPGSGDGGPAYPPPKIPPEFRNIVSANQSQLTVRSLSGGSICVPIDSPTDITQLTLLQKDRYLGVSTRGDERFGFTLVDRDSGQSVETGGEPTFSDDGSLLASVQASLSEMGLLEGIAIWEVSASGFQELAAIHDLPSDEDRDEWMLERVGPAPCAFFSSVPTGRTQLLHSRYVDEDDYQKAVENEPRDLFLLHAVEGRWRLDKVTAAARCA